MSRICLRHFEMYGCLTGVVQRDTTACRAARPRRLQRRMLRQPLHDGADGAVPFRAGPAEVQAGVRRDGPAEFGQFRRVRKDHFQIDLPDLRLIPVFSGPRVPDVDGELPGEGQTGQSVIPALARLGPAAIARRAR